ncbi:MAG: hypothetical protein LBM93_11665 [Oscillospiraceae bacterium]|jgi:hypothetical protein|nr:hypothetical protein [Oscillospiraceae bacterium]
MRFFLCTHLYINADDSNTVNSLVKVYERAKEIALSRKSGISKKDAEHLSYCGYALSQNFNIDVYSKPKHKG